VSDGTIAANLEELSKGKLTVADETKLIATNEILARNNAGAAAMVKKKKFIPRNNQGFQKKNPRFSK
jgi:hypothetical protein